MNEPRCINILGVNVHHLTLESAVARIIQLVHSYKKDRTPKYVATVNVDFFNNIYPLFGLTPHHPESLQALQAASLVTADGMPIVWLSRWMGDPLPARVTGVDLIPELMNQSAELGLKVYILGGDNSTITHALGMLTDGRSGLDIVGHDTSKIDLSEDCSDVVERINSCDPDILLIALGNPKQELLFHRYRHRINTAVAIGIGGTLNFLSGSVPRAPTWMQKTGFEWLYRLYAEPKRLWKRYLLGGLKWLKLAMRAKKLSRIEPLANCTVSETKKP